MTRAPNHQILPHGFSPFQRQGIQCAQEFPLRGGQRGTIDAEHDDRGEPDHVVESRFPCPIEVLVQPPLTAADPFRQILLIRFQRAQSLAEGSINGMEGGRDRHPFAIVTGSSSRGTASFHLDFLLY